MAPQDEITIHVEIVGKANNHIKAKFVPSSFQFCISRPCHAESVCYCLLLFAAIYT